MKLKKWVFDLSVKESIPEVDDFLSTIKFDWLKQYEPEKIIAWADKGRTKQLPIDTSQIDKGMIWIKMDLRHKSECFLEYAGSNKNIKKKPIEDYTFYKYDLNKHGE